MTKDQQRIYDWRKDPVKFVRENFKVEPDVWQAIALRAFASGDKRMMRIALKACAGPGKSAVMSWMGWNFLSCYGRPGQHPKGAVVAITGDNLKDNLWPEFSKWQNISPYLTQHFTWTSTRLFAKDHPETWFLSARSWSKTANEEEQGRTLSGVHSEFVLFLIDESGDIPVAVLKSAEQALSNCVWGKIVQSGNPTSMTGMLYAACTTLADLWWSMSITGDPDDPNRSPRIGLEWARQQIAQYGRKDPWVMAYILGQFPPQAMNALISPDEVEAAMNRVMTEAQVAYAEKRIGVDCARFGDDRTVIARRQGLAHFAGVTLRNADGPEVAARVATEDVNWGGSDTIFLDTTGGWGSSAEDSLRLAQYKPFPVNFSAKATDPRYFNLRSQMLCEFCEAVKRGACLPKSQQLKKEMTALTYFFQDGKKRVIEKDQIKAFIKCSPDECDAYATTYAIPDRPRQLDHGGIRRKRNQEFGTPRGYSPFEDSVVDDYERGRRPL